MRKFLFVAFIATLCMSCTSESFIDVPEVSETTESQVKKVFFDSEEDDAEKFWEACVDIIQTHKDFENFQQVLGKNLTAKMLSGNYTVFDAVEIIYRWWKNDETFDVMVEWPTWDDFIAYLPKKFFEIYPF